MKDNYLHNKNSLNTLYRAISQILTEEKTSEIDDSIRERNPGTVTTPEEVTQRAYFNVKRSEGDVSPEDKAKYDSAFQDQQKSFSGMSPDAQKKAAVLWGNPTDPNYRTTQFNLARGSFNNSNMRGLANGRTVTVASDKPDKVTIPHEMTHVQQFSNTTGGRETSDALRADTKKDYREKDIEAGAQSKAEILALRNAKSPEDALKPLSQSEVNKALDNTKGLDNQYVGFEDEPENIKAELKKYMQKMIVKNNTENQEGTATT